MRRLRIGLGAFLLAVAALAVLGLRWLLYTESGLHFVLGQLQRLQAVKVVVTGTRGPIAGPLSVDRLLVDHETVRIEADGIRIEPRFRKVFLQEITLSNVRVAKLRIELKHSKKEPEGEMAFLPRFLQIVVPDFAADDVTLRLTNGEDLHFAQVSASATLSRWRIQVPSFRIEDPAGRLDGSLRLRAARPLGLRGNVVGHWRLPDQRDYHFRLDARGDLDRLGTEFALTQPARLTFNGTALTLTSEPQLVGTARVTDFDLSPWVPAGTLPRMDGSIATFARLATPLTVGIGATLVASEFGDGPLRLRGGASYRDRVISIEQFRAWLPRSSAQAEVQGTVELLPEQPSLALELQWKDLRWPLAGEPVIESPTGRGRIDGTMPLRYDLTAETRGPGVPAASWQARGSIDTTTLVVDSVDGSVLKGRVKASGRISWKDAAPWAITIDGNALDLAELRPDWPGRIDMKGSIEGRGLSADAPWSARIANLSGTLRGRRLTGRGEVAHRGGVYELRQVRISNVDSRVDINGRVGKDMDLRWDAQLASLSLVDPALRGQLVTSGRVSGTMRKPRVTGTASVRDLSTGTVHFRLVSADMDLDVADHSESHVDIDATEGGIDTLDIERINLRADGNMSGHSVELRVVSPGSSDGRLVGFRANVAADGSYSQSEQAWRGTLQRVSALFPDDRVQLLQPAGISLSPSFVQVAPLCLSAEEARLCFEGEWSSRPQSWRVIYSAQDWPLQRILVSLLGRRDFDGKLQASGWASQEPGKRWVGSTTLLLDAPTIDIPRNKFRTDRIKLGNGRLDLFAETGEVRATLDGQLTEGTHLTGNLLVERLPSGDWKAFPLSGRLEGKSAILTAIPLFVPEIDRSEGELDGRVTASGTLGEPRFNGELHVHDGRFELYRTNLVLSDTDLDARFEGDTLEISGRGKTAKGEVTLEGRFGWPDGVMTGSMRLKGDQLLVADTPYYRVLASPDLEFRAAGGGYEVDGDVLIPMARITPKQLTTSVGTSPDERIVGVDTGEAEPSTMQRVTSRVRVVFGDDVRVDTYGLKAKLGGELTVVTRPDDVSRGNGSINLIEGEYSAFGTNVKITRGKLSYDNAPLGSPTIDLVAERRIEDADVTVAINVRGPIGSPFIDLTSTPAMSSNEALSYLIVGKSIDTLQSGEAASIDKAAQSLAVSGGGLLLGGLSQRFGLDSISLERTGEEDTSVVLGKFLSPKLFVSYGISIAEAINTVKLRYTLNEKWSLKAEAGLYQSADVEYRIER